MGWAARRNPLAVEHPRMKRLRTLCRELPREVVLDASLQMSDADQAIVRRILDTVQPPEVPCLTH